MALVVRRARAALRLFDPDQNFFHDARIVIEEDGEAILETHWKNPELAGVWLLRYKVLRKCLDQLKMQSLIERDLKAAPKEEAYKLSKKGMERLG